MKNRILVRVSKNGMIFGLDADNLSLQRIGHAKNVRLSTVEFYAMIQKWRVWSLPDGRFIGGLFDTRKGALAFEKKYMEKHHSKVRVFAGVK